MHEDTIVHHELEALYKRTVSAAIPDPAFLDYWFAHATEGYYPTTLSTHFHLLETAGFHRIALHWLCGNQAVFSARRA
jgi:hypothetical protein